MGKNFLVSKMITPGAIEAGEKVYSSKLMFRDQAIVFVNGRVVAFIENFDGNGYNFIHLENNGDCITYVCKSKEDVTKRLRAVVKMNKTRYRVPINAPCAHEGAKVKIKWSIKAIEIEVEEMINNGEDPSFLVLSQMDVRNKEGERMKRVMENNLKDLMKMEDILDRIRTKLNLKEG